MQKPIYIIIFSHTNGTDFIRAICEDVISLSNCLRKLLPDFEPENEEKFFNKLDEYKLISKDVSDGTYHIYDTSCNQLISICLLHG